MHGARPSGSTITLFAAAAATLRSRLVFPVTLSGHSTVPIAVGVSPSKYILAPWQKRAGRGFVGTYMARARIMGVQAVQL